MVLITDMNISRENEGFYSEKADICCITYTKAICGDIEAAFKNLSFIKGFVISRKTTDTFTLKPEFLENCFVFC